MNIFSIREVFKIAIQIEENGQQFYHQAVSIAQDEGARKLFGFLAGEEVRHREIFTRLLADAGEYESPESYAGEWKDYLTAYASNIIFPAQTLAEKMSGIRDTLAAIEFALKREMDSIYYYQEMKNFVPQGQRDLIQTIIEEERKHFMKLVELKKGYNGK